jgi:peptidoglycan L-alanyl-D-glutamate endopeptidase CwlK
MPILKVGSTGTDVESLQQRLKDQGFDPGNIDGDFGFGTEAAVMAFQNSNGLLADGIAGPMTLRALGASTPLGTGLAGAPRDTDDRDKFTVSVVSRMFPFTPIGNIKKYLPFVLDAVAADNLADRDMILMALATIRAETEGFVPISEGESRFNSSPNGHPFDLYDKRRDLGNKGAPDGASFKGRGFIQLTGRHNYTTFGPVVGADLVKDPRLANDPTIAAKLLAAFLKAKESRIRQELSEGDLKAARRLVNGGSHGLDRFTDAFKRGSALV